MKKILVLLLIIVLAAIIAPFFIGSQAETKIRHIVDKTKGSSEFALEINEYDRGWFSSNAKIRFQIRSPQMGSTEINFTQKIQHGPLLWQNGGFSIGLADIRFGLELPQEIQDKLGEINGFDADAFSMTSRLLFDGSNQSEVNIEPFTIDKDNSKIDVKAGQFTVDLNSNGKMTADGEWQGLSVAEHEILLFEMAALKINVDQTLVAGEMFSRAAIYEGGSSISFEQLNINGKSPAESVKVNEFLLETNTSLEQDLAKVGFIMSAKELNAVAQTFNDVIYDISFENIDKESLLIINSKIYSNNPAAVAEELMELLPQLIGKKPLFKVNKIGVTTSDGEVNITATAKINDEIYDSKNPMSLMLALDVEANGEAPEPLFANLGMANDIEMLVQQNMLVRDQDKIKFELTFKDGQALLNGAPMPMM